MWVLRLFVLCSVLACAQAPQVTITGTLKYPDGTNLNGQVAIQFKQATVTNACTTPIQVVTLYPVYINVAASALATLKLYPTPCLVPSITNPTVRTGSAAGKGATVGISGTDLQASLTLTFGTGATAGPVAVVKFGQVYHYQPQCIVSLDGIQYGMGYQSSTLLLTFNATSAMTGTHIISYYCALQPYTVQVRDSQKNLLYTSYWIVPNQASADITQLDVR